MKCFKCQELGHLAIDCKTEIKCTTCNKTGHGFRNCPISFANKIKHSSKWVQGGASPVVPCDTNISSDDEAVMEITDAPLPTETPAIVDPLDKSKISVLADSNGEPSLIPDTQDPSDEKSQPTDSQTDLFDDNNEKQMLAPVPKNWAECTPLSPQLRDNVYAEGMAEPDVGVTSQQVNESMSQHGTVHKVDESASQADGCACPVPSDGLGEKPIVQGSPPHSTQSFSHTADLTEDRVVIAKSKTSSCDALENMKMLNTTQDSHDWATVSRGRCSSQPNPSRRKCRSRSNIRFPKEDPMDSVKMAQIFLEDEPWHSCHSKSCRESFSKFEVLLAHVAREHPNLKPPSYPCARKSCRSVFDHPKKWILHLASRHPDFVKEREIEYFDRFFLKC